MKKAAMKRAVMKLAVSVIVNMSQHMVRLCCLVLCLPLTVMAADAQMSSTIEPYCEWQSVNHTIKEPLCGLTGDAVRGQEIASNGSKGNCVACHSLPVDNTSVFGTIGPPLEGVGSRLPVEYMRLRIVDSRDFSPMSIMPGFYRNPEYINRPGKIYAGRTFLTAQQIEDVIAYLVTLK
jgi:sulfur-oxidizing protein SoxX